MYTCFTDFYLQSPLSKKRYHIFKIPVRFLIFCFIDYAFYEFEAGGTSLFVSYRHLTIYCHEAHQNINLTRIVS